jgi:hypothetical protein
MITKIKVTSPKSSLVKYLEEIDKKISVDKTYKIRNINRLKNILLNPKILLVMFIKIKL